MSQSLGWYSANRTRSYPLEGYATGLDDFGRMLPAAFIADLKLRFPGESTERAFVRYAECGKTCTIVIASQNGEIASATIGRESVNELMPVALVPAIDGVTGHIVFGSTSENGVWVFSNQSQSGLSIKAATPELDRKANVRFHRQGFPLLSGPEIRLIGNGDVTVTRGIRTLSGVERSAVIVSLDPQLPPETIAEYAGQCGRRPETENCQSPNPITRLGDVSPDCCGRVFVEFRGCVDMLPLSDTCGVLIRCEVTTEDACPASKKLPDESGLLPDDPEHGTDPEESPEPELCADDTDPQSDQAF